MRLPRKQYLRKVAQQAFDDAEDFHEPIIVLPTIYKLVCVCGLYASVAVPRDRVAPRFRCKHCGSSDVRRVV